MNCFHRSVSGRCSGGENHGGYHRRIIKLSGGASNLLKLSREYIMETIIMFLSPRCPEAYSDHHIWRLGEEYRFSGAEQPEA